MSQNEHGNVNLLQIRHQDHFHRDQILDLSYKAVHIHLWKDYDILCSFDAYFISMLVR